MPEKNCSHKKRVRASLVSLLAVVLSSWLFFLAFPDGGEWWLAWIALSPLLARLPNHSPRFAFILAYLWALLFHATQWYWLSLVTVGGYFLLVTIYSLIPALCLQWVSVVLRWKPRASWFLVPCAWVSMEFLMAKVPVFSFPWSLMGNSQAEILPVLQLACVTGVYGISFMVIAVNTCIAWWLTRAFQHEKARTSSGLALTAVLAVGLFVILAWGRARLQAKISSPEIRVSMLQGSHDHLFKWSGRALDQILQTYSELNQRAAKERPLLIVWPETAVPCSLDRMPWILNRVKQIVRGTGAYSLVGALKSVERGGKQSYNTAFLLAPNGEPTGQEYYKRHLVPFGEYTPFPRLVGEEMLVRAGATVFAPGRRDELFQIDFPKGPHVRFGVLICFEAAFPSLARDYARKGANCLVNITNDAWYADTSMPYQHSAIARVRAVENGLPLIRTANSGRTMLAGPLGRIRAILTSNGHTTFFPGVLTVDCPVVRVNTVYSRIGDAFALLCVAITVLSLLLFASRLLGQRSGLIQRERKEP